MAKVESHIQYRTQEGRLVPGVTTILGILAKPALLYWAWDLGRKGIDYRKYRDSKADIGTLAHYLILQYLLGRKPDTSDYSKNQIDKAENCFLSYLEWEKNHEMSPFLVEKPLVSEKYLFGGTVDLYCQLDGKPTVIDFKTGKNIYDEAIMQLSAYSHLLAENGHNVEVIRVLRIGRDESEGFEEKVIYDSEINWQIFLRCLGVYRLKQSLKSR